MGFIARVTGYFYLMILTQPELNPQYIDSALSSNYSNRRQIHPAIVELYNATTDPISRKRLLRDYPGLLLECDSPPLLIGGVNSQGVQLMGYDWLTVNCSTEGLQAFQLTLDKFFPGITYTEGRGKNGYLQGRSSTLGIFLSWTPSNSTEGLNPGHVTLAISGGALAVLTMKQKFELLTDFHSIGATCSRLDVKFRDHAKAVMPSELRSLAKQKTEHGRPCVGFRMSNLNDSDTGETFYGGSRGNSEKYLRVYDAMHKHDVDAVDWEMELKAGTANSMFDSLANLQKMGMSHEELAKICAGAIFGQYKFVHRTDKNVARCKPLLFMEQLREGIEAMKICVQKVKSNIEKTKKWVYEALPNSLMMVCAAELGISAKVLAENGTEWFRNEFKPEISRFFHRLMMSADLNMNHLDKLSSHQAINPPNDEFNINWFYEEYCPSCF